MNLHLSQPVHLIYPAYLETKAIEFYRRLSGEAEFKADDRQLLRFGKTHLHLRALTQAAQPPLADIYLTSRMPAKALLNELHRRHLPVYSGPVERAVRRGPALGIRESIYLRGPLGELIEIGHWKYGPGALLGWYSSIQHVLAESRTGDR